MGAAEICDLLCRDSRRQLKAMCTLPCVARRISHSQTTKSYINSDRANGARRSISLLNYSHVKSAGMPRVANNDHSKNKPMKKINLDK